MKWSAALLPLMLAPLLGSAALAAPGGAEVEGAALRVAQGLDGVLRNCPASYAKIGSAEKRCVGVGASVEQVRVRLGTALGGDLYGVWRSRDEQRSVYNWVRTPGGYVYLRLQPDPDGRAETLIYLDLPPEGSPASGAAGASAAGGNAAGSSPPAAPGTVTLTPAPGPKPAAPPAATAPVATGAVATPAPVSPNPPAPAAPAPASSAPRPATTATANSAARSLAPVAFRRVLALGSPRLNGNDVLAVQNRLIVLMRPVQSGRGDGWYGPVTAATVRAFQTANRLPVTGQVDRTTWDRLFSPSAATFAPPRP